MKTPAVFSSSGVQTTSYADLDAMIDRVKLALDKMGIKCAPNSALGFMFNKVKLLHQDFQANKPESWVNKTYSLEAWRIARSLEVALDNPDARQLIRRITKADMRLSLRKPSEGKDALWELDLFAHLFRMKAIVRFSEPPDLTVSLPGMLGWYGIACKKVYSHNNVEKQMRKGFHQLSASNIPGVVAFNLDDLTPEERYLSLPTKLAAASYIQSLNAKFFDRHTQTFLRYGRGLCDGVLVSTNVEVNVEEDPGYKQMYVVAMRIYSNTEGAGHRLTAFQHLIDGGQIGRLEVPNLS